MMSEARGKEEEEENARKKGRVLDEVYREQAFPMPSGAWKQFATVAASRHKEAVQQLQSLTAASHQGCEEPKGDAENESQHVSTLLTLGVRHTSTHCFVFELSHFLFTERERECHG